MTMSTTGGGTDLSTGPTPQDATLGTELITNGTFATDASGWTSTGWTYSSGKITHNTGNTSHLSQNISITNGVFYLVKFDTVGTNPLVGTSTVYIDGTLCPGYTYTEETEPATNYSLFVATRTASVVFEVIPSTDMSYSYDNISVKGISANAAPQFQINDYTGSMLMAFWGNYASRNTAIGVDCLKFKTNAAYDNNAFGHKALNGCIKAFQNVAIGNWSQSINGAAWNNTSVGFESLRYNISGFCNTAIGCNTMTNNSGGAYNTAVGNGAMKASYDGYSNTLIGVNAGYGVAGNYNVVK